MIQKVRIQNFKSVLDLEIELGRVNIFIGENGSGKTSVLEGIAMGAAASRDKLENEFLGARIRNVEPELMLSAFFTEELIPSMQFAFDGGENEALSQSIAPIVEKDRDWTYANVLVDSNNNEKRQLITPESAKRFAIEVEAATRDIQDANAKTLIGEFLSRLDNIIADRESFPEFIFELGSFLLYAPENHFLRRFEEEGQIRPLGIRGEGLFRHLSELSKGSKDDQEIFAKLNEHLQLIDWFEGFSIPNDLQFTERRIAITDRFIKDTIAQIDQRSANEGFLYLLFYFTLFLSKYTPAFFAIDNIDNALNPRLCAKLVQTLVKLAAENDKQAIFTTHNPAVLDGLDLEDDMQRLFVIYRNRDGETKARRVMPLQEVDGVEKPTLSEAFMRGYLGGLPQNF